jgi:hypothetical protein
MDQLNASLFGCIQDADLRVAQYVVLYEGGRAFGAMK